MESDPAAGDLYRSRKKQTVYRVLHQALDCTNSRDGTSVVVYTAAAEPGSAPSLVFVRERGEFLEKFERI